MRDWSRRFCTYIYETEESLCSRAYIRRDELFWKIWIYIFGETHCRNSYNYYWSHDEHEMINQNIDDSRLEIILKELKRNKDETGS